MSLPILTVVILAEHRVRCDAIAKASGVDLVNRGTMHTACISKTAEDDAEPTHFLVSGPIEDGPRLQLLIRLGRPENSDIAASIYHVRTFGGLIQLHSADLGGEMVGSPWSFDDTLNALNLRLKPSSKISFEE